MTDSKTATELLEELRDLACDMNAKEIIEHIQLYPTCVFKDKWLDAWHNEFDRITQAVAATLGSGECEAIHDTHYYIGINGICEGLYCSECEEPLSSKFMHCPWCGAKIRKAVKR